MRVRVRVRVCVCVCLHLPLSPLSFVSLKPHPPPLYNFCSHFQPLPEFWTRVDLTVRREQTGVIQTFAEDRATQEAEAMLLVHLNLNGSKGPQSAKGGKLHHCFSSLQGCEWITEDFKAASNCYISFFLSV